MVYLIDFSMEDAMKNLLAVSIGLTFWSWWLEGWEKPNL